MGPFATAVQRNLPVLAINVMKVSAKKYRLLIKQLDYADEGQSIKVRAERLAHAYARNLERVLDEYPTQWFNYFEFWN